MNTRHIYMEHCNNITRGFKGKYLKLCTFLYISTNYSVQFCILFCILFVLLLITKYCEWDLAM